MSFGTFKAKFKKKIQSPQPSAPKPTQPPRAVPKAEPSQGIAPVREKTLNNIMEITVSLVGRTVQECVDYLVGLNENMNTFASSIGLAFFAENNSTLSVFNQKKREIEQMLTGDNSEYVLSQSTEGENSFSLLLSQAGVQDFNFRIHFVCCSGFGGIMNMGGDVVLVLCDAPVYENTSDPYVSAMREVIRNAQESNRPVFVVLTQFEQYGRIRMIDNLCDIESYVFRDLKERCNLFLSDLSENYYLLPAQIYGGLIYKRTDEYGNEILGENTRDGLTTYKPEGCHLALMFAMEAVNSGPQFVDNSVVSRIKSFNRKQRLGLVKCGAKV